MNGCKKDSPKTKCQVVHFITPGEVFQARRSECKSHTEQDVDICEFQNTFGFRFTMYVCNYTIFDVTLNKRTDSIHTSLFIVPKQINKIYKLSVTCFMELNNCGHISSKVRWKLQITIGDFFPTLQTKNNHLTALP